MKIIVTGVNGQLGYDLVPRLIERDHTVVGTDLVAVNVDIFGQINKDKYSFRKLDITDRQGVFELFESVQPDAVIHCAAWTAVDVAEEENNEEIVNAVNVKGTEYIAEACKLIDATMLYISTDYVFNGTGNKPWEADCKDFAPLNEYGKTKLKGEHAVSSVLKKYYILRTSWVFGAHGNNFVKTMLRVGKARESVSVVNDQIGTPTYTKDLSVLISEIITSGKYGYYHGTNSECAENEYISWADFAEEVFRLAKYKTKVKRVTTEEYGLNKAARPLNSRLDKSKLAANGFTLLPDWKDALQRYMIEVDTKGQDGE